MAYTSRQAYNRMWRRYRRYFGQAGQPPPELRAVKRGGGFAYTQGKDTPSGYVPERRVYGNPDYRRQLKSAKKQAANQAKFTTLHEWGHLFGPGGTGATGNEGQANRAANIALRKAKRQLRAAKRSR